MVSNRKNQKAILLNRVIKKNELLEPVDSWEEKDDFIVSINQVKNTTIVNGALVYLITFKAITKYRKIISKENNRILIPSTKELYLIEDVGGYDGLFNTLTLKRITG